MIWVRNSLCIIAAVLLVSQLFILRRFEKELKKVVKKKRMQTDEVIEMLEKEFKARIPFMVVGIALFIIAGLIDVFFIPH